MSSPNWVMRCAWLRSGLARLEYTRVQEPAQIWLAVDGRLRIDAFDVRARRVLRDMQDGSRVREAVTSQDERREFGLRWREGEQTAELGSGQMFASRRTSRRDGCDGDFIAFTPGEF